MTSRAARTLLTCERFVVYEQSIVTNSFPVMPQLLLLQGFGFAAGLCASLYVGYRYLVDPLLVARYRHLALVDEVERQMQVEESRLTAELNLLERMAKRGR